MSLQWQSHASLPFPLSLVVTRLLPSVDNWIPSTNGKLIALAELKQSPLQKALSGELPGGKEASTATLKEEEVA